MFPASLSAYCSKGGARRPFRLAPLRGARRTDQSDAGSAGISSRRTNQMQPPSAWRRTLGNALLFRSVPFAELRPRLRLGGSAFTRARRLTPRLAPRALAGATARRRPFTCACCPSSSTTAA
eukprot:9259354-Pyramimonas_sp.AAC.1